MVVPFLRSVRTRRDITWDTGGCYLTFCCFPLLCQRTKKKTLFLQLEPVLLSTFRKERTISRPWSSFLQQDEEFSEIFKGIYLFTFEEIREATNDFEDRNIIGREGSKVTYRGLLRRRNKNYKMVAVKLFKNNAMYREELQISTYMSYQLRHRNITSFLGYCKHKQKFMLIYEYELYESLDRLLLNGGENLLNWNMRYKICLEIADCLTYLHENGITHTNFNPSNILINAEFVPKIDVFSILSPARKLTYKSEDTYYGDSEYLVTGQLTARADVHTYGVFILDIVTGNTSSKWDSIDHIYQGYLRMLVIFLEKVGYMNSRSAKLVSQLRISLTGYKDVRMCIWVSFHVVFFQMVIRLQSKDF